MIYGSDNKPHLTSVDGDVFGLTAADTDKLTVQAWIRWTSDPSSGDSNANIFSQTTSGDGSSGSFWLQHNGANSSFEFAIKFADDSRRFVQSDPAKLTIKQGVWYLVTGVYNGSKMKMFVNDDDVSISEVSTSGNLQAETTSRFNIGKMAYSTRLFSGNIRNVRLWVGTARGSDDIAADYANTPLAGSLADDSSFSWPLNETSVGDVLTGNGIVDLTMENVVSTDFGDVTLPVELSSFTVSAITNGAKLQWISQSENNLMGYYVYRSESDDLATAKLVSSVIEATNMLQTQVYVYTDTDILTQTDYYYWLLASEYSGEFSMYGPIHIMLEESGDSVEVPLVTGLSNLYPNPFNPELNIRYSLKKSADVVLSIYNLKGQKVHSKEISLQAEGYHQYTWDASKHSSGIYFVVFNSGKIKETRKVILNK